MAISGCQLDYIWNELQSRIGRLTYDPNLEAQRYKCLTLILVWKSWSIVAKTRRSPSSRSFGIKGMEAHTFNLGHTLCWRTTAFNLGHTPCWRPTAFNLGYILCWRYIRTLEEGRLPLSLFLACLPHGTEKLLDPWTSIHSCCWPLLWSWTANCKSLTNSLTV